MAISKRTDYTDWLHRIDVLKEAIKVGYASCNVVNNTLASISKQEAQTISNIETTTARLVRQINPDGIQKELKELEAKFATFENVLYLAERIATVTPSELSTTFSERFATLDKPRKNIQNKLREVLDDSGVLIKHLYQLEQDEQSYVNLKIQLDELLEKISATEKSATKELDAILQEALEAKYETENDRKINQEIIKYVVEHKNQLVKFLCDVKDTQLKVECALLKHKKALQDVLEKQVEPIHQLTSSDSSPSPVIQRFLQTVQQLGEAKQSADAKTVTTLSDTFTPLGIQIKRAAVDSAFTQVVDSMPKRLHTAQARIAELKLPAPKAPPALAWGLTSAILGMTSYIVELAALVSIMSAFTAGAAAAIVLGVLGFYLAYRCLQHARALDNTYNLIKSDDKSRAMQHQFAQQDKELEKQGFSQAERSNVIKSGVLIHSLNKAFFENRGYRVETMQSADAQPCSVVELGVLSERSAIYRVKSRALLFKPACDAPSIDDKRSESESSLRLQPA